MVEIDTMAGSKLLGEEVVGVEQALPFAHGSRVLWFGWDLGRNECHGIHVEDKAVERRPQVCAPDLGSEKEVVVQIDELDKTKGSRWCIHVRPVYVCELFSANGLVSFARFVCLFVCMFVVEFLCSPDELWVILVST